MESAVGKWRNAHIWYVHFLFVVLQVSLKSGRSVVTWKAMVVHGAGQPIFIRQIDVSGTVTKSLIIAKLDAIFILGLPFSGQCTLCSKGTYSTGVTSSCIPCPPGTFAPVKGSSSCGSCDQDFYSGTCFEFFSRPLALDMRLTSR